MIDNPFSNFISPNFENMVGQEFLERTPRAAYFGAPSRQQFTRRPFETGEGIDPTKQRFYQQNFQTFYDDYLAKLGEQAYGVSAAPPTVPGMEQAPESGEREYGIPTLTFRDYLASDPFTEKYSALTPEQKGIYTQNYSPRTRTLFY